MRLRCSEQGDGEEAGGETKGTADSGGDGGSTSVGNGAGAGGRGGQGDVVRGGWGLDLQGC